MAPHFKSIHLTVAAGLLGIGSSYLPLFSPPTLMLSLALSY